MKSAQSRRRSHHQLSIDDDDARVALAELSTRLNAMDADYTDLRGAVLGLGKRIDDLGSSINAKIDQRSQPQWQTYIAGAMLLGGLFFAFIAPIQKTQEDNRSAIKDLILETRAHEKHDEEVLERRNELFVTQKANIEYQRRIDAAIDGFQRNLMRLEKYTIDSGIKP